MLGDLVLVYRFYWLAQSVYPDNASEGFRMFQILDCSLRDGGYYTDWDFSDNFVDLYIKAVRSLPISVVEIGYLSPSTKGYKGKYFYLNRTEILRIKNNIGDNQKLSIMFNLKDCSEDDVYELLYPVSDLIDIVRFACPPDQLKKGIILSRICADLGCEVSLNFMYLNKYINDTAFLAELESEIDVVQYVALVDSYGSCFPDDVNQAVNQLKNMLPQEIGFHGHDNIGLAFGNALAAVSGGATYVDATFTGMGRGAGNLTTELICSYWERETKQVIDYTLLANSLTEFEKIKNEAKWGTSLPYIVSGMSSLPQAEVMSWLGTRRYNLSSIVAALKAGGEEGVGLDSRILPEINCADFDEYMTTKTAVIIGGGDSVTLHRDIINQFLENERHVSIHSSLKNAGMIDADLPQIFCLPGQDAVTNSEIFGRAVESANCFVVNDGPRLPSAAPHHEKVCQIRLPDVLSGEKLGSIADISPLELSLGVASLLGAERIWLFGFDGYSNPSVPEALIMERVEKTLLNFKQAAPNIELRSLLPTMYNLDVVSIYELV